MTFIEKYEHGVDQPDDSESEKKTIDPKLMSPDLNPATWLDVRVMLPLPRLVTHYRQFIHPVVSHTCFDGVDLPLFGVTDLLKQPVPETDDVGTDFDLYLYIMFRPATQYAEFGGLVCQRFILPSGPILTRFP